MRYDVLVLGAGVSGVACGTAEVVSVEVADQVLEALG
jgi:L-2-hydroxyglutarate oxidase LhgO